MKTGLVLVIFSVLIGEYVAPPGELMAQSLRTAATKKNFAVSSKTGYWARDDQSVINIRYIVSDIELSDITIFEFDDHHQLRVATHARTATFDGKVWNMNDVEQSIIEPDLVAVTRSADASWQSLLNPDLLGVVTVKPQTLSISGLHQYIYYLNENGLESVRYELAFWNKLLQPFNLLIMLLLSIPFVFGPTRSTTAGQRIVIGVGIGLAFGLINTALGRMGLVYGIDPRISASFPGIIAMLLGLVAIHKYADPVAAQATKQKLIGQSK